MLSRKTDTGELFINLNAMGSQKTQYSLGKNFEVRGAFQDISNVFKKEWNYS